MEQKIERKYHRLLSPSVLALVVFGGLFIYQFVQISALTERVDMLSKDIASTTNTFSQNTLSLSQSLRSLSQETVGISSSLANAQQHINAVRNQVGGVEQTVGTITGTVGTLQKLVATDAQLLRKYSKVYFLNENYTPLHLTIIPSEYTYDTKREEQFLAEGWNYLKNLLDSAKADNVTLYVKSGYRSFYEQKALKSAYSVMYGAGTANAFSADQGYSEHQLGTGVDFITTGLNGQLVGFDKTASYTWLLNNAHKFGFILSYPKGNSYYVFEPWHWRFVGIKLATDLYETKRNFYDLDQREIDKYLVNLFD